MKISVILAKARICLIPAFAGMTLIISINCAFAATTFEQANEKYRAGDFKVSAELYAKAIENGETSGAAHYNLGNALFRLGQKGKALASYERARKILPRDTDVAWNINLVQSTFLDRLDVVDEPIFVFWAKKIAESVSFAELAFLVLVFCAILFVSALVSFIWPAGSGRLKGLQVLTLAVLLCSATLLGFKIWQGRDARAVVTDAEIFARYGPSGKETKAFLLHEGAEGWVSDEVKDWVYVTLANKSSGWVPKKSCEII